jgi:hypothetical protein
MSKLTTLTEQIRDGWVVFSNWKRVPTCGRVQAENDFDAWLTAVKAAAWAEGFDAGEQDVFRL